MPKITKCSTITGFPVWQKRCISAHYEIVYVENAELANTLRTLICLIDVEVLNSNTITRNIIADYG